MKLRVLPTADTDVDESADYYAREADLQVALRFYDAVEASFQRLLEHPDIGVQCDWVNPKFRDIYRWPVPGFEDHRVFFRRTQDSIEVTRALHARRDLNELLG